MPRFFTLAQAERALPGVEKALRELLRHRDEHQRADGEFQAFTRNIMMMGGTIVDHSRINSIQARKEESLTALKRKFEEIQEAGVLIKDPDSGLIDFPTLYKDQEVYLCWRFGESAIAYWHAVEDGFRGRKRIDQEFLSHHRGDDPTDRD
ncbi:MAG: DUF2203 domain-containing protein [Bryobacteraceae bacterium]